MDIHIMIILNNNSYKNRATKSVKTITKDKD